MTIERREASHEALYPDTPERAIIVRQPAETAKLPELDPERFDAVYAASTRNLTSTRVRT